MTWLGNHVDPGRRTPIPDYSYKHLSRFGDRSYTYPSPPVGVAIRRSLLHISVAPGRRKLHLTFMASHTNSIDTPFPCKRGEMESTLIRGFFQSSNLPIFQSSHETLSFRNGITICPNRLCYKRRHCVSPVIKCSERR